MWGRCPGPSNLSWTQDDAPGDCKSGELQVHHRKVGWAPVAPALVQLDGTGEHGWPVPRLHTRPASPGGVCASPQPSSPYWGEQEVGGAVSASGSPCKTPGALGRGQPTRGLCLSWLPFKVLTHSVGQAQCYVATPQGRRGHGSVESTTHGT